MVAFKQIPSKINTPGAWVELDASLANAGLASKPHTALIFAQGGGTANELQLVVSPEDGAVLGGIGSQADLMVRAFRSQAPLVKTYLVQVAAPGGGAAAEADITITGEATSPGVLALEWSGGGRRTYAVDYDSITDSGTTAAELMDAIFADLADIDSELPFTATQPGGAGTAITLTVNAVGIYGNGFHIGHSLYANETAPAGLTFTITDFASGSGDPDWASAIAAIPDELYNTWVIGTNTIAEVNKFITELASRGDAMMGMGGVIHTVSTGTQSALETVADSFNSQWLCHAGMEVSALTPTYFQVAALLGGEAARMDTIDPSRSFVGHSLVGAVSPHESARFTRAQRDALLDAGITTFKPDPAGNMVIERAVTSYTANSNGFSDLSYQDLYRLQTLLTMEYQLVALAGRFIDWKLSADGPIPPGQPVMTPSKWRGELVGTYDDWHQLAYVDLGARQDFIDTIVVDLLSNRIEYQIQPTIIGQTYVIAGQLSFKRQGQ